MNSLISKPGSDAGKAYTGVSRLAPFAYGFRPFFLLAGLDAVVNAGAWLGVYLFPEVWPQSAMSPMYWHAHEMIFGFIVAAIAGFLLTAVPGWTGRGSYGGAPLILLSSLWLLGRVVLLPFVHMPQVIGAIIDLSFLPALALTLAPPLIRAYKFRNMPFLLILALLFVSNLVFHLGTQGVVTAGEHISLAIAIDIVCILIVIVGGRIIPAFTKSGLAMAGRPTELSVSAPVEHAAIASVVAMLFADLIAPLSQLGGVVAVVAAIGQGVRLSQWQGQRTLRVPLVWVLHVGYAWLATGLLLKGIWLLFGAGFANWWIHALTVGAFGTMILAVMTRASLGHTGRRLMAPQPIAFAYVLVSLAAIVRVFAPSVLPDTYKQIVAIAAALWIAAFAIFLWIYTPILMRSRVDGRPG